MPINFTAVVEKTKIIEDIRQQERERVRVYVDQLERIAQAAYTYQKYSTPDNSQEAKEAHSILRNELLVPIQAILQEK